MAINFGSSIPVSENGEGTKPAWNALDFMRGVDRPILDEIQKLQRAVAERDTQRVATLEKELRESFEARQKELDSRESHLNERAAMASQAITKREARWLAEVEKLRAEREELRNSLDEVSAKQALLSEEGAKKAKEGADEYLGQTILDLDAGRRNYFYISLGWNVVGLFSLAFSVGFFVYITYLSLNIDPSSFTWQMFAFSVTRGVIVLAILAAIVGYSSRFGSSYMRESLKNSDRIHALKFGQFYLRAYGVAADWSQVRQIFEHWNISGGASFGGEVDVAKAAQSMASECLDKAIRIGEKVKNSS